MTPAAVERKASAQRRARRDAAPTRAKGATAGLARMAFALEAESARNNALVRL